ncbi:unnamed protein product [Durusdinium trenchii]|uniref:Uncharacterized protein n=1 Tax=Durusdinium trenchii TaxID=1381693 RepID=A0ABP0NRD4_9DINO
MPSSDADDSETWLLELINYNRQASSSSLVSSPEQSKAQVPQELKKHIDETLWNIERAPQCFSNLLADWQLECQLPKKGSSTGTVVRHAIETFEKILRKHGPMVFKFGWTHDAHCRFRNPKFGYVVDPHQRWQTMVVVFASHESIGPAFLEAFLIEKFQGTPGCRNVRSGGDTIIDRGGPFFTYVVYQSFKFPPSGARSVRSRAEPYHV